VDARAVEAAFATGALAVAVVGQMVPAAASADGTGVQLAAGYRGAVVIVASSSALAAVLVRSWLPLASGVGLALALVYCHGAVRGA